MPRRLGDVCGGFRLLRTRPWGHAVRAGVARLHRLGMPRGCLPALRGGWKDAGHVDRRRTPVQEHYQQYSCRHRRMHLHPPPPPLTLPSLTPTAAAAWPPPSPNHDTLPPPRSRELGVTNKLHRKRLLLELCHVRAAAAPPPVAPRKERSAPEERFGLEEVTSLLELQQVRQAAEPSKISRGPDASTSPAHSLRC